MTRIVVVLIFLLLAVCSGWAQTTTRSFSYSDIYGNNITIANTGKLPAQLDTTFFKLNLTGLYFDKNQTEKSIRYDYTLSDIKQTKKKNEVEVRLTIVPHSKDFETILKHLNGCGYYKIILRKETIKN